SAGVLRAGPAGRPAAAEDRPGGHGPLPGPGDVGDAAARNYLAGEPGPGRGTVDAGAPGEKTHEGGQPTNPTSGAKGGPRLHPEVRHGAMRRRWCEWGRPQYVSWCPATAGDAEWMFGRSRNRLAPVLTGGSSWMPDRRRLDRLNCAIRSS